MLVDDPEHWTDWHISCSRARTVRKLGYITLDGGEVEGPGELVWKSRPSRSQPLAAQAPLPFRLPSTCS